MSVTARDRGSEISFVEEPLCCEYALSVSCRDFTPRNDPTRLKTSCSGFAGGDGANCGYWNSCKELRLLNDAPVDSLFENSPILFVPRNDGIRERNGDPEIRRSTSGLFGSRLQSGSSITPEESSGE